MSRERSKEEILKDIENYDPLMTEGEDAQTFMNKMQAGQTKFLNQKDDKMQKIVFGIGPNPMKDEGEDQILAYCPLLFYQVSRIKDHKIICERIYLSIRN